MRYAYSCIITQKSVAVRHFQVNFESVSINSLIMGLAVYEIELDHPEKVFFPGQDVTGKLLITITKRPKMLVNNGIILYLGIIIFVLASINLICILYKRNNYRMLGSCGGGF